METRADELIDLMPYPDDYLDALNKATQNQVRAAIRIATKDLE